MILQRCSDSFFLYIIVDDTNFEINIHIINRADKTIATNNETNTHNHCGAKKKCVKRFKINPEVIHKVLLM